MPVKASTYVARRETITAVTRPITNELEIFCGLSLPGLWTPNKWTFWISKDRRGNNKTHLFHIDTIFTDQVVEAEILKFAFRYCEGRAHAKEEI
jgi:hypothetical protein